LPNERFWFIVNCDSWWHEQGDNQACVPILPRVVTFAQSLPYFFPFGLVCDRALAATDFVFALVRPSRSNLDALVAMARDVCLEFALAMIMSSSPKFVVVNLAFITQSQVYIPHNT